MAVTAAKAGLVETTITTGTGSYALLGAVSPPWRGFIAADDGKIFGIGVYQDGVGFEEGEYTYNHGARTLARTTIRDNHLGTQSPVDWGAGSKEVSNVLVSSRTMQTTVENKIAADQFMRAFKLYLDSGDTTWLVAASNIFRIFLASTEAFKLEQSKLTFTWSDDTATEGPELKLARVSASAAVNDALAVLRMTGSDSAQNEVTALKVRPVLLSVTPGAHSSRVAIDIAKVGALQPILQLQPDTISVQAGVTFYSAGKTTSAMNTVGAEFSNAGVVIGVAQDAPSGVFMRKGSGGAVLQVGQDGVVQGEATIAGATVTWGGFTGHHWAEWEVGFDGTALEVLGTVVQTANGALSLTPDPIKYVLPAQNGSRRVYGVIGERQGGRVVDSEDRSLLLIFAVGNGWIRTIGIVEDGDLLWASATAGLAEAQPDQDVVGPWTVAKALGDSAGAGEDLVPCTYMAGG